MAANFYCQTDAPHYKLGHSLELGFISASIIAALILVVSYSSLNKKRSRMVADGQVGRYSIEELSAKGDKALTFRYMY